MPTININPNYLQFDPAVESAFDSALNTALEEAFTQANTVRHTEPDDMSYRDYQYYSDQEIDCYGEYPKKPWEESTERARLHIVTEALKKTVSEHTKGNCIKAQLLRHYLELVDGRQK